MANKALPFAILTIAAAGAAAAAAVYLASKDRDNKLVARITDYLNGIKKSKNIPCDCEVEEACCCECTEEVPAEETCCCEEAPADEACCCEEAPADEACCCEEAPADEACCCEEAPADEACCCDCSEGVPAEETCCCGCSEEAVEDLEPLNKEDNE